MAEQSFRERVAQTAIDQVKIYQEVYMKFDYLLCSKAFLKCGYFILAAEATNYRHLIGVNTTISAEDFFLKCTSGSLTENDFDFCKKGQSEKSVKGSVREKITALPAFLAMMDEPLMAQEGLVKNRVRCSFATADKRATVGFIDTGKARPMTLLRGDKLDSNVSAPVDLILRRPRGEKYFSEIVRGGSREISEYYDKIEPLLDETLKALNQEPTVV